MPAHPTYRRHRSRSPAARVAAVAALAVVVAAIAAWFLLARDDGPSAADAAGDYAAAWAAGRDADAAGLTDRPREAGAALAASRRGLDGAKVSVTAGSAKKDGDTATATLDVAWDVPGVGRFARRTSESPSGCATSAARR